MNKLHTIISFIWHTDKNIQTHLVINLLITLVAIGLNASFPLLFKQIINALLAHSTVYQVSFLVTIYGVMWIVHQATLQLKLYLTTNSIEAYSCIIRQKLFIHLLSLPIQFHVNRKTGHTASTYNQLQRGLESIFWGLFSYVIPTILELLTIAGILTYLYGYMFGVLSLATSVLYIALNLAAMQKIQKTQEKYNVEASNTMSILTESLLNIETIFFFNNKQYEQEKLNQALQSQKKAAAERDLSDFILQIIQLLSIGISLLVTMLLVANNKNLNVSDFILINTYILQFTAPLQHIGYLIRQIGKGIENMSQALQLFKEKPEPLYALPQSTLKNSNTSITFKNVYFGYTEQCILKNVSFDLPHGKTVAIVGPTGSGKSTIAKLLFRFYTIQKGHILLNGTNIQSLAPETVRTLIGIVPQEPTVFNDTIANNIRYGQLDATKEEIEEVIRLTELDTFIRNLPDGLETIVGERGLKISGGEKQRIALARMLIKKPLILVFDEASSSLDMQTELKIQKNIRHLSKNKTTLIIAHRLTTITHADTIVVLDKGHVVEQGTHEELKNIRGGMYETLWNTQQERSV